MFGINNKINNSDENLVLRKKIIINYWIQLFIKIEEKNGTKNKDIIKTEKWL